MIVIDMDMPKNCNDCNLQDNCGMCLVCGRFNIVDYESNERPQDCPIKCDIEDIKAEIDSYCSDNRDRNDGLYIAMRIIDKHTKETESEE